MSYVRNQEPVEAIMIIDIIAKVKNPDWVNTQIEKGLIELVPKEKDHVLVNLSGQLEPIKSSYYLIQEADKSLTVLPFSDFHALFTKNR